MKFFKRCGTFRNVRNGVADFFFARFKSGVHGSDALNHKLHVGNVQILLTALFGVILLRRNSVRGRGEQIDLMQSLPLANIHQGFLQVLQIVFGKVVLVASLAVDRTFGEWLRVNIKFAQAVDYNMGVNVACAVFTIGVSTDQSLMPRKIGLCIFHADGLRPLTCQVVVCVVFRIVADDIMVAFDFIVSVVLVILLVQQFAFKVERFRITVQSLKIKFFPEHHVPVFIKDGNQMKFIMLVFQIVDGTPIIGIFTCDVF